MMRGRRVVPKAARLAADPAAGRTMRAERSGRPRVEVDPRTATKEAEPQPQSTSRAPAVNRAVAILRVLADAERSVGVNTIARTLGMVPSTCYHILRALEDEAFVSLDPVEKKYTLGLGLVTLARDALRNGLAARNVQQQLNGIVAEFNVTAAAIQLDNKEHMVIVAEATGSNPVSIRLELGRRLPAYLSATGRCLAAHSNLSTADLRRKFERLHWQTAPTFREWLKEVDEARGEGIGLDRGNYVRGFTVIAAPVMQERRMTGSLVGICAHDQLSPQQMDQLKERLRNAARQLTT